jgi:hypothetical protein
LVENSKYKARQALRGWRFEVGGGACGCWRFKVRGWRKKKGLFASNLKRADFAADFAKVALATTAEIVAHGYDG